MLFLKLKEITLVRERLFHKNGSIQKAASELPEPSGPIVTLQKKVFVPVKENPNYNFVGRLLGPRGLTAKQMEQDLGCKIMVRGKGSMRDKRKEDQNRGKPNWEHLQEELHVLVSVEDYESRAEARLQRAVNAIQIFLEQGVKTPEDKDVLKQTQLMELAVLNDKDRQQAQVQQMTQQQQQQLLLQHQYMTLFSNPSALAAAAASQNPHLLRLQAAANSLGGLGPSSLLLQNSVMPAAAAACMVPAAAAAAAVAAAAAPPSGNTGGNASNTNPLTLQQIQQSAILQSAAAASSLADPLAAFLNSFGPENSSGQLNFTSAPSGTLPFLSANGPSMAAVAAAVTAANRDMQHSNMLGEYTQSGSIDGNAGALKLKPNSVSSVRMHPYLRQ